MGQPAATSCPSPPPSSSFAVVRLNKTTFRITEDDSFGERPFIYAKLHPRLPILILSDAGCNSPRDASVGVSKLRVFLEECPVPANEGRPLNPRDDRGRPERHYTVIVTHCHYDHIGALEQFPTPPPSTSARLQMTTAKRVEAAAQLPEPCDIVASGAHPSFVLHNLAEHSLCKYLDIAVPAYRVSKWARDGECLLHGRHKLDVTALHTPGHTPDELAWYDHHERWLYVGDSFYERGEHDMPIIFPKEGDWVDYVASLSKLLSFVRDENAYAEAECPNEYDHDWAGICRRVRVGCGHSTSAADAEEVLDAVFALFSGILAGKVPVKKTEKYRGEMYDTWMEDDEQTRFSVRAPRRLAEEARKQLHYRAMLGSMTQ